MMKGNVAQELELQIREAIEKMVADIRSSIDDVREIVDQQLQAALQSVQADANTTSFRAIIDGALAGADEESTGDSGTSTPSPQSSNASRLKRSIQQVERGRSQVEVLNALLDQSLLYGSRAALLILKGDAFAGWKGVGFAAAGGDDEAVKRFSAPPGTVGELDRVMREEIPVEAQSGILSQKLGVSEAARAIAIPMVIKDKVAAAVVVEVAQEDLDNFDADALSVLVFTTGLLIDTLAIRKRIPSPSLGPAEEGSGQRPAPAIDPRPAPAPAPPPPPPPPVAAPAPSPAPEPPAEPVAPKAGGTFGSETAAVPADLAERSSTQYVPPPGLQRRFQKTAPEGEEAKRHDEARRFARLLVSEIKLYNETKVDQGRKNRDLYERLKEDIDRSRQMYDERIPDDVRKSSNYFYDELVRILADGQADILGL